MTYKILICIMIFFSGFVSAIFVLKDNKTLKIENDTQSQTKTIVEPTSIVYQDKVRQIRVECPKIKTANSAQNFSKIQVVARSSYTPSYRLALLINPLEPKDVNQYKLSVGYFIGKNLSLDAQTNIKFDTVELGVSFYF